MRHYVIHDGAGRVLQSMSMPADVPANLLGANVLETTEAVEPDAVYVDGDEVKARPPRPSDLHDFDMAAKAWVVGARARDAVWERIKAMRDQRSEHGGVLVAGKWFHSDLKSRTQWERMVNRSAVLPDAAAYAIGGQGVMWKTMDGSFTPLTAGLIRSVVVAMEAQELANFARAEQHRAAMLAAPDPTAYDYTTGWPAIYTP